IVRKNRQAGLYRTDTLYEPTPRKLTLASSLGAQERAMDLNAQSGRQTDRSKRPCAVTCVFSDKLDNASISVSHQASPALWFRCSALLERPSRKSGNGS